MEFDNARFEQNVRQSMNTLMQLNKTLEMSDGTRGLENIADRAKNLQLDGISTAVDTIADRFSAMGIVGMNVLSNIANSAIETGKKIIKALAIDPVKTGLQEYELNMNSIQTIMAGTGEDLQTVNKALDELNLYADKTIYSFSDMTSNIGKFTNAGVDLKTAVAAIKGVSNEAALSGANAQEASRAMYNFAQALSAGYVKLIDWKSIENANMATKDFKQNLLDTAVNLGTVVKVGEKYKTVTTDNKGSVSDLFDATHGFNEALANQWMTTDVLTTTLAKYSDETTEVGKKAYAAAQDIKTFTQLADTLKEAAQSGWSQSFRLVIGDFDEAKELWGIVNKQVSAVIDNQAKARNKVLQDWHDLKGRQDLIDTFTNTWRGFEIIIKSISNAINSVFKPLDGNRLKNATRAVKLFSEGFENLSEKIAKTINSRGLVSLKSVFKDLHDIGKRFKNTFRNIFNELKPGSDLFVSGFYTALSILKSFTGLLNKVSIGIHSVVNGFLSYSNIFDNLKDTVKGVVSIFSILVTIFKNLFSSASRSEYKGLTEFGSILGSIADKILSFTGLVGRAITSFSEYIKKSNSLTDIFITLKNIIGSVLSPIASIFKRLRESFDSIFSSKDSDKKINSIEESAKTLSSHLNKIQTVVDGFMKFLKDVGSKISTAIGPFVDGVKDFVKNADFSKFFKIFNQGLFAGILIGINKFINGFGKNAKDGFGLKGMLDSIKSIFDGLSDCLGELQKSVKANTLKKIAVSVGILAASLLVLSLIDPGKLAVSLGAITTLFGELFGMMAGLGGLNKSSKMDFDGVSSMANNLIKISGAMLIMSVAFKKLGSMDWKQYAVATAGLSTILAELTGAMLLMSNFNGDKSVGSFIGLAVALTIMGNAFKSLGSMKWSEYAVATAGMSTVIAELVGATLLLSNFSGSEKSAGTLVALAFTLTIIGKAFKSFGTMDWGQYAVATAAMSTVLTELVGVTVLLTKFNNNKSTAGILIMAASLAIMAKAFKEFGSMNWSEYAVATAAMSTVLTELIGAMVIVSKFAGMGGAASLLVASASIIVLAEAFKIFGSISWEQFAVGVAAMGASLAILLGAAAIASLGPVSAGLLILAGAIALIGAGAFMAGIGITAFATGLAMLVAIGGAGITVLTTGLLALIALIPAFMAAIGEGLVKLIESFVTTLALSQGTILTGFAEMLLGMLDMIIKYLPQFIEKGGQIIVGFLRGIADNMQSITEAGIDIIINFLKGINSRIDEFNDVGTDIIVNIIHGIGDRIDRVGTAATDVIVEFLASIQKNMERITQAGWDLIIGMIDGISDSISKNMPRLRAAIKRLGDAIKTELLKPLANIGGSLFQKGLDAVNGFINGVSYLASSIYDWGASIASKFISGLKDKLGINSPSKVTRGLAHFSGKGFVLGVKDYFGKVVGVGSELGGQFVDGMSSAISKVSDIITSDISMSPTITPVLNLSEVQAGVRTIGGMLNGQTLGLTANVGAINALMTQRQLLNDNSDVVNAVNRLRRSIEENPSVINNIGDVTYDDGSNVSIAVNDLIHAIKVERRV